MSSRAEAHTHFLDAALDSLVRQDFASIDKQLGLLVYLHPMVRKFLHDSLYLRTVRRVTPTYRLTATLRLPVIPSRNEDSIRDPGLAHIRAL